MELFIINKYLEKFYNDFV